MTSKCLNRLLVEKATFWRHHRATVVDYYLHQWSPVHYYSVRCRIVPRRSSFGDISPPVMAPQKTIPWSASSAAPQCECANAWIMYPFVNASIPQRGLINPMHHYWTPEISSVICLHCFYSVLFLSVMHLLTARMEAVCRMVAFTEWWFLLVAWQGRAARQLLERIQSHGIEARLEALKELAKLSADPTFAAEFINMEGIGTLARLVESGTQWDSPF